MKIDKNNATTLVIIASFVSLIVLYNQPIVNASHELTFDVEFESLDGTNLAVFREDQEVNSISVAVKLNMVVLGSISEIDLDGQLKILYDNELKNTYPLEVSEPFGGVLTLAEVTLSANELESWSNNGVTNHVLKFQTTESSISITFNGGYVENKQFDSAETTLTVIPSSGSGVEFADLVIESSYDEPEPGEPIFYTDFVGVTLAGARPSTFPDFPFRTNINYKEGSGQVSLSDGVLRMHVLEGMPTHDRCEFNCFIADLPEITNEYCVRFTMKFPEGYYLTTPHDYPTWNGWNEIGNPFNEWNPSERYYDCHLVRGENNQLSLFVRDNRYDAQSVIIWKEATTYDFPDGEWFTLQYAVKRSPTNGEVKIWINNQLIFDVTGVPTMLRNEYYVQGPKLYGGEILPEKTAWLTSYAIYDQIPE